MIFQKQPTGQICLLKGHFCFLKISFVLDFPRKVGCLNSFSAKHRMSQQFFYGRYHLKAIFLWQVSSFFYEKYHIIKLLNKDKYYNKDRKRFFSGFCKNKKRNWFNKKKKLLQKKQLPMPQPLTRKMRIRVNGNSIYFF